MSVYPPSTNVYNLRVPMPIPRTPSAPFFNGRYIDDFLNQIVRHGTNAGITDANELVHYIVEYSSNCVKDLILYMDEFDRDRTDLTWNAAKNALIKLFGSTDKPKEYTVEELREFCQERAAKPSFITTKEVEEYLCDFIFIAAGLKKRALITEREYNLYFVRGIPDDMKDWFASALPEEHRVINNPPSEELTLKTLKARFDKKSIVYKAWNKKELDKDKSFDQHGNRVTAPSFHQEMIHQPTTMANIPGAVSTPSVDPNSIEGITQQLEKLTLALSVLRGNGTNGNGVRSSENIQTSNQGNQGSDSIQRRCFMCGQMSGNNGAHKLHPRFCPETNALISEHLITFDSQRSRYTLPNGQDLPRVPAGWNGGVSTYLRHLKATSASNPDSTPSRDPPPHMRSGNSVGLVYNDSEVLTGNAFALESVPSYTYSSNPTTRSGRDTSNRFNPLDRAAGKSKDTAQNPAPTNAQNPQRQVRFAPESQPQRPQQVPQPVQPQPTQQAQAPAPAPIPPPSNPINTERGWKSSRPGNPAGGNQHNQDVEMKDGEKKGGASAPNSQYHFTSKVQEMADPDATFSRIGDMKVEVPLFELLGMSPALAKLFTENTRTKREYGPVKSQGANSKQAEYSAYPVIPYDEFVAHEEEQAALSSLSGTLGNDTGETRLYVSKDEPDIRDFVFRCSNAVARIPSKRFFAMTVGDLRISINGVEILAMIDTGSELNVAGSHLPELAGLPMDYDGMRWSLKGINGDYERLRGCVIEAPIVIGGHNFAHHVFISHQPVGRHDIILGQPFLQWFSARIDYERGNHVKLYLWNEGDRSTRPTIMVSITDPNDARNTTAIRLGSDVKSAFIEEVEDSGF